MNQKDRMSQKDRMIELLEEMGIIDHVSKDSLDKCAITLALELLGGHYGLHEEFRRYAFNLAITTLAKEIMYKHEVENSIIKKGE